MRIKYLGTAAAEGWPGVFCHCKDCEEARRRGGKNIRTRAQVLINEDLLMDFGPDTYMHSLVHQVDLAKVRAVLLTHSHTDHFYPSELILHGEPYALDMEERPITLYGNETCGQFIKRSEKYENKGGPLDDSVRFQEIKPGEQFTAEGYEVLSLAARHDPNEQCMIYSVKDVSGKRLLYANDTGLFPEETWENIRGLHFDLVSMDCTMGIRGGYDGHMSFADNLTVKERLLAMGCADAQTIFISTHFSHTCCMPHEEFTEMAAKHGIRIAWDGMELEF